MLCGNYTVPEAKSELFITHGWIDENDRHGMDESEIHKKELSLRPEFNPKLIIVHHQHLFFIISIERIILIMLLSQ